MTPEEDGARRQFARSRRTALHEIETKLDRRRRVNRFFWLCLGLTSSTALTAGSAVILGGDSAVARQLIGLCLLALIALLAAAAAVRFWVRRTGLPSRVELEKDVDKIRDEVRWLEAGNVVETSVHQLLYKADIPAIIAQYQAESDKYRKIHNRLQSLIIVGSLSTTTAAALEAALPGHRWITVGLSFLVGMAAGFMGYFKFRERSFYLQQTADVIEQEVNAMTLRVHDYKSLDTPGALSLLVERVEGFRNEQRRRQQQLDQPVDERALGPNE